ncbi:MAG TPA: MFS transporter [Acidobacteriota bacterium]|nr:MFS transporter [Acidobacteriota bacterium]
MSTDRPTNVRWQILGLLFGLSFISYVVALNMSIAAPFLAEELGISNVQMGWIFSAMLWGYSLFQLPGGIWGQRAGARRVLTILVVAWSVLTALTALIPGAVVTGNLAVFATLLIIRFVLGAARAPFYPVMGGAIERWFPVGRWALPQGLGSTGLGLGGAVTPPLVAWLMLEIGWRGAFYAIVPLGLLGAWIWWRLGRDDPRQHWATNPAEIALIGAGRGDSEDAPDRADPGQPQPALWKQMLRDRNILLLTLSYFSMNYVFYFFFNWFYIYLLEVRGFGMLQAGFVASLPWLAGALMASVGGEVCDRLCGKLGPLQGCRLPSLVGLPLVGVFLMLGILADSTPWAIILLTISFSLTQFTEGTFWAGASFVAGKHTYTATGILNTGGNLGGVVSSPLIPIFVGWFGWTGAVGTGAIMAVVSGLLWLGIRVDEPFEQTPTGPRQPCHGRDGDSQERSTVSS